MNVCTLLGKAIGGGWFLASTSDDPYTVRNQLVCECTTPCSYVAVRVVTDDASQRVPWNHMLTRGLNSAGLACTYAYVHEQGNEELPAQTWVARMLARVATVEDAVRFMETEVGRILSGNYLLCDAEGSAAAVEVSRTEVRIAPVQETSVVRANAWQILQQSAIDAWGAETAMHRASRAQLLLRETSGGVGRLLNATRDHIDDGSDGNRQYGISICNHGCREGTISAELLDSKGLSLWWTYGWPCGHARGYEKPARVPWGRFLGFGISKVRGSGEVTTLDGEITPLGIHLVEGVEDCISQVSPTG